MLKKKKKNKRAIYLTMCGAGQIWKGCSTMLNQIQCLSSAPLDSHLWFLEETYESLLIPDANNHVFGLLVSAYVYM